MTKSVTPPKFVSLTWLYLSHKRPGTISPYINIYSFIDGSIRKGYKQTHVIYPPGRVRHSKSRAFYSLKQFEKAAKIPRKKGLKVVAQYFDTWEDVLDSHFADML